MKKSIYICLLFSFCGVRLIYAESERVFSQEQLSLFNKLEGDAAQGAATLQLCAVDVGESEHSPFTKKKKRFKKAVLQVLICPTGRLYFTIVSLEIERIFSPKIFYFFHPDFAHGKRGPPFLFLVS